MKVLLIEDVDNLGLAGEVTDVAPGYGRNYLLPQQLAILATPGAMKQAEAIRKAGELKRAQEKADAEAIANQIDGQLLVFERRAGDRGQLYGSVTASDIAEALSEKVDIEIDRRKINLPEPLRSLGEWDVTVRLMIEVSVTIHVAVIAEGETYVPGGAAEEEEVAGEVEGETDAAPGAEQTEAPAVEADAAVTETEEESA